MTTGQTVVGLLLAAGLATGADPPVEKLTVKPRKIANHEWILPAGTPAEQMKWIIDRQKRLQEEFSKKYKAAKTEAEKDALFDRNYPEPDVPGKLLLDIALNQLKDPSAFDALLWVVRYSRPLPNQPQAPFARARDVLIRDFAHDPRIGELCQALAYENEDRVAVEFVRKVYEKHPDAAARAQAGLTRASHLRRDAGYAGTIQKATPEVRKQFVEACGQEYLDYLLHAKPDDLNKEAEGILDRLVSDKELAKVTYERGDKKRTVGDAADAELFEIRYLLPGKTAPDIAGDDIDGKRFKLSEYRGKVVLLDFWGDW
jgi:hypothetical protein